ncbi:MAG: lysophospholipid acyltransferase family protein [Candidatus Caenarcaniphilales bacterium]|nr:lysophospholipid acyltransferase family protein [Candidatus Caenarcaniphilales bacterium]
MLKNLLRQIFFLFFVRPFLLLLIGVNVFGRENLKDLKQFIIASNHNSHLDTLALMNLFPLSKLNLIRPVAASDYFMKNQIVAWFCSTFINILPIPRGGFNKSCNPVSIMSEQLQKGNSLIIFPEGSRGEPEKMSEFKSGIAHLILKHPEIPVIPVFIKGMGRTLPKGELIPIPFFCDIVIGEPIHLVGEKEEITKILQTKVFDLKERFFGELMD